MKPSFISHVYAYQGGLPQAIPDNVNTPVVLDTVLYDSLNEFNIVTYTFTARHSGFYSIKGKCQWTSVLFPSARRVYIRLNGVAANANDVWTDAMTQVVNTHVETTLFLNVGSTVELIAYQASGGAETLSGLHAAPYRQWLIIDRIN
jgi:hypothetical protein